MKAFWLSMVSLVCVGGFFPLLAQEQDDGSFGKSDFYVVTLPVERVFTHSKGYIVEYRKSPLINKKVYLPIDWFTGAAGRSDPAKGELILMGTGLAWPHLAVYYKGNTVDHVRLYVRRNERHFTWGQVTTNPSIDSQFENISDLKIEYN